ncbi:uncharacterized protein LOC144861547 [Branchiostoma floridae x Branchiostoma japonicum]
MAAAPSSLGTQFHEELTCSICLELFTRPKVLPCQHTFCQDCLQDHAGRGGAFQCPNCRQQVRMPHKGVAGLPDNHLVTCLKDLQAPPDIQPQSAAFHPTNRVTAAGILLLAVILYSLLYWQMPQRHSKSKTITFGGKGSENEQFDYPCGVAVSDEGEIFVADRGNQRIQVFTLQGSFVRQFPTVVSGEEKMHQHDVARDGEGNLWVVGNTESAECAVQYNKQGRVLRKFDLQKTGWNRGVAVDTRTNHILITQTTGNGEVSVFRPDGTLVKTVGPQQGIKFLGYMYITVDREGNILVSDWLNDCVYVYNEEGQFLFQFGGEGSCEGRLQFPHGICTDRAGNIIVADSGNSRVSMFDKTGKFLKHITTGMVRPLAVAMATHGQLVVTDTKTNVIQIIPLCIV